MRGGRRRFRAVCPVCEQPQNVTGGLRFRVHTVMEAVVVDGHIESARLTCAGSCAEVDMLLVEGVS